MNNKITTQFVSVETQVNGITLKGELEYWAKDYCVRLIEPFQRAGCGSHLQYGIPVIYVFRKSENPSCIEIELEERSKEILKSVYLNSQTTTVKYRNSKCLKS